MRMERRRDTSPIPTRSDAYQKALFSALVASLVALMTLKFFLGLAFMAAALVAVVAFMIFFGMAMRMTPRSRD
jgi:predicted phage tail protein